MKDPEKIALRAEMERRECRFCLYYETKGKRCSIGMDNCPFFFETGDPCGTPPVSPQSCSSCAYGKGERPCVSFCMKKVLREWRNEKNSDRKEAAVYA